MCGVGSEPGQDAIWIAVRKRVDLHCVVGACRHQLAFLWRKEHVSIHRWELPCSIRHHESVKQPKCNRRRQTTNLECEGVRLFPDGDELWIVIIQTLPYPNISIISAGYNEPEENFIRSHLCNIVRKKRVKLIILSFQQHEDLERSQFSVLQCFWHMKSSVVQCFLSEVIRFTVHYILMFLTVISSVLSSLSCWFAPFCSVQYKTGPMYGLFLRLTAQYRPVCSRIIILWLFLWLSSSVTVTCCISHLLQQKAPDSVTPMIQFSLRI